MATSDGEEPAIRLLARRSIGTNARFDVYFDDIEDERGNRVQNYVSVIPRVESTGGVTGIAVLPVRDGAFGMMRMARHPYGGNGWEIPMGFIDADETPQDAALREMQEETGLNGDPARLLDLGGLSPAPSVIRARINLYAVHAAGADSGQPADETGHGRFAWIPADEAVRLADRREIVEPCTLVSLYRYLRLLG